MEKTLCTTNRIVLYDLDSKTKEIKVTGDSFGRLKEKTYKSLSELEKVVFDDYNRDSMKRKE